MYSDDAIQDEGRYAIWLAQTYDVHDLRCLLHDFLVNRGFSVPPHFTANLETHACAEFMAENEEKPQEIVRWVDYCVDTYPCRPDASLTTAERNPSMGGGA